MTSRLGTGKPITFFYSISKFKEDITYILFFLLLFFGMRRAFPHVTLCVKLYKDDRKLFLHLLVFTLCLCVQWTSCSSSTSSSTSGPPTSTTRKSPEWIADRLLFRNLAYKALQKVTCLFYHFKVYNLNDFVIARTIVDAHFPCLQSVNVSLDQDEVVSQPSKIAVHYFR